MSAYTLHLSLAETKHGTKIVLHLGLVVGLPEQATCKGDDFASAEKADYLS